MSETEHHKGKLVPVEINGDLENTAKEALVNIGVEDIGYCDTWLEAIKEMHGNYIILNSVIYEVEDKEIYPDTDIFESTKNDDGTIDFEIKYYNGGCGFNEAIEYATIKNIKGIK